MARRIVDLSMPVHPDMLTFPRVPPPALCVYESHEQFAERIGAAAYGVDSLTGQLPGRAERPRRHAPRRAQAHRPDRRRARDDPARVVLLRRRDPRLPQLRERLRHHRRRRQGELDRIEVQLKERDIVLNQTGAGEYNTEERYRTDHPGHDRRGHALADLAGRAADGLRRDHLRPAGLGDVRAQAVLGGPPGDVGRGVLAPREPHEPRARSAGSTASR